MYHILIVDDESRIRSIIRKYAEFDGHTVTEAGDGMEAVVLCMMGCALGIFLSWGILQLVSTVVASLDIVFALDGGVVALAVIFCFIIGVVFGLYPANKAAKMKPIDALHYGG